MRTFHVKPVWDAEAEVYYAESDIVGLHIEAKTFAEFEGLLAESALELIIANHMSAKDFATKSIGELMPAIVVERPVEHA